MKTMYTKLDLGELGTRTVDVLFHQDVDGWVTLAYVVLNGGSGTTDVLRLMSADAVSRVTNEARKFGELAA